MEMAYVLLPVLYRALNFYLCRITVLITLNDITYNLIHLMTWKVPEV